MIPPISTAKSTDARGSVVQSSSFDAWGRRRNPSNWTYSNIPATLFSRGYTGHSLPRPLGEHLDVFGLINMNGRMYDPILARFLSVDPYVKAVDNTQSYNRYSYCWNNPLAYTDPTGYLRGDPEKRFIEDLYPIPVVDGKGGGLLYDGFDDLSSFTHNGIWQKYGVGLGREAGPTYEEWKRSKEAKENINKLESVLFMYYHADEAVAYGYTKDGRYVAIPLTNVIIKVYIGPDINFVYEPSVGSDDKRVTLAFGLIDDFTFAVGPFGISFSTGSFTYNGKDYTITSFGHAMGLDVSAGINAILIKGNPSNFNPNSLSGWSGKNNISFWYFSYSKETPFLPDALGPFNPNTYLVNSPGAAFGLTLVGISRVTGYTWITETQSGPSLLDLYISRPGGY